MLGFALISLLCRRVLGRLDIFCSQGFGEVDEAALYETRTGLMCSGKGRRQKGGKWESQGGGESSAPQAGLRPLSRGSVDLK